MGIYSRKSFIWVGSFGPFKAALIHYRRSNWDLFTRGPVDVITRKLLVYVFPAPLGQRCRVWNIGRSALIVQTLLLVSVGCMCEGFTVIWAARTLCHGPSMLGRACARHGLRAVRLLISRSLGRRSTATGCSYDTCRAVRDTHHRIPALVNDQSSWSHRFHVHQLSSTCAPSGLSLLSEGMR